MIFPICSCSYVAAYPDVGTNMWRADYKTRYEVDVADLRHLCFQDRKAIAAMLDLFLKDEQSNVI